MGIFGAIGKGFSGTVKLLNVIFVFLLFNVAVGLISIPLANPTNIGTPGTVAISIVSSVIFFLIFIFLQGGALGMVKDSIKTGRATMANFLGYGRSFYPKILGLLLIYVLIAIGIVLLLSLISAGILLLRDNIITRSIVAAIVTVVAVTVITFLIYPIYVIVADGLGPIAAFRKGFGISKANFWATLGLFIIMLLISLAISLVIGFLVGLVTVPLPARLSQIVIVVVNAVIQSFIPIVMMVAFMNFYMSLVSTKKSEEAGPTGIS